MFFFFGSNFCFTSLLTGVPLTVIQFNGLIEMVCHIFFCSNFSFTSLLTGVPLTVIQFN